MAKQLLRTLGNSRRNVGEILRNQINVMMETPRRQARNRRKRETQSHPDMNDFWAWQSRKNLIQDTCVIPANCRKHGMVLYIPSGTNGLFTSRRWLCKLALRVSLKHRARGRICFQKHEVRSLYLSMQQPPGWSPCYLSWLCDPFSTCSFQGVT